MGSVEHLQRAHPPNPSISLHRNVVSYADGPRGNSTGRLLFYLTTLDATAYDAQANASAMLTVSEAQLPGSCRGLDAEDPPCAKISILGELHRVPASEEGAARDWPAGHEFHMYELFIQQIQLLAWYGGPRQITPQDYFGVQL
ncbi:Protein CREG1 [Auxenochlorella protothecoides]|uniref:Protein CREG1 n=1 Tax=Auxenochlorella protothecoides TaxID=3075 RepID=A0A087SPR4_AUXPR|nr:Protein CREG1 [Auxenochlorella protothecoides]KFM27718.1 Protein CREG1 [Auxenochlorella protothecoides]